MIMASPSLTRHDVPSSVSSMRVRKKTVDCRSSAWVIQKWHWFTMFGLRILNQICSRLFSAGTTSMSWQRMGMKLTSVTWLWRKHMHQIHLKKRYACGQSCRNTWSPRPFIPNWKWLFIASLSQFIWPPNQNLQLAVIDAGCGDLA